MAAEPKRRHSKARKRTRRAAISLSVVSLIVCKNCGNKTRPHIACITCGYYHGKATGRQKAIVTKA
ncbi:50S ribosomal protein L32 [Candidatus Daviesbacteria bacterium RIFCSPHIGHO2_12_FULL_37_11]|uniref:Large ribosomal subunit protein bL32 n=1 Tax=Candidatus Daviesbacteria bacterium RIFCSPHIGHO2_12_FULL_37_11 TaxID=1797777 RepID=A0A1F5KC59_9BACT|nr:MAG: 50S ribosomal protein L32 [Candidatus Daviesbacteria bacterium GWA1_38_6]OGE38211.1 MAG: 50S ribosomal protein L32 [Candidatus Daviesbacteria bacterium RIFCSPHIGHO2_12_FULL_37_11]OGE45883.1 MAG: 50S ribosomal protein L32 [Candidatus Daviesbacteria bacterium RIFCSPLOWO2_01_FULL_37_10]